MRIYHVARAFRNACRHHFRAGYHHRAGMAYLAGNLIVRSGALMLGLLVMYDALKTCLKE